ncbi:MAG: L-histidine N(alpha)-methyltransferase [Bryobacterales bacterium]|nr:L-histidine N(alpha)-methyltransferase [Bryobacterales bacterium]
MKIEVLLTETEIADEFHESLTARDLPEKFFYWTPLSARCWLALANDPDFEGLTQVWKRLASKAGEITEHMSRSVAVVSLGAGDGAREEHLLNALQTARPAVEYFPVDASQPLLEAACARAEDAEVQTLGIKADISSPAHLVLAADASESPKLFLLAGNTLGAFDPLDMLRSISQSLRPDDRLIVDGLVHREDVVSCYDSPAGRRFAFAPLSRIGFLESDGKLRFEEKRDQRHAGLYLITRSFQADGDLSAELSGGKILVQRGERISMNFSYAYTPEAFRWLLEQHAGLKVIQELYSPFNEFILAVCAKAR